MLVAVNVALRHYNLDFCRKSKSILELKPVSENGGVSAGVKIQVASREFASCRITSNLVKLTSPLLFSLPSIAVFFPTRPCRDIHLCRTVEGRTHFTGQLILIRVCQFNLTSNR